MENTITVSLNDIKKDLYRSKANAKFSHYCAGNLYYVIELTTGERFQFNIKTIEFEKTKLIDLLSELPKTSNDQTILENMLGNSTINLMKLSSDLATTPFNAEIKASELIRWVTKSYDSGDLIKIN